MKNNRKYYLAYGSNLDNGQMLRRCPDACYVGATEIDDHVMVFRSNYRGNGVANIEPFLGAKVPGCVWEISECDEQSLDIYEGWPRLYRKEMMTVEVDGKLVEAMVYVMNEGFELTEPSDYYLDVIQQGYVDCALPLHKLDEAVHLTRLLMD